MSRCLRLIFCVTLGLILAGCWNGLRGGAPPELPAPALGSAYGDLREFWQRAAGSLNIPPEQGRLQQMNLGYDDGGKLLYMSFQLYVDRYDGTYDLYYFDQSSPGRARWTQSRLTGKVPAQTVPAHRVFAAINEVGIQTVEAHQKLTPPARFWFFAGARSGRYQPRAGGFLVEGDQITPIPPDGLRMEGEHGSFGMAEGAISTGEGASVTTPTPAAPGPPLFLVPLPPGD